MSNTATRSIASVGQLCAWLQRSPREIREACDAAGIIPAMRINDVDHFHESDVPAIRAALERPTAKGDA